MPGMQARLGSQARPVQGGNRRAAGQEGRRVTREDDRRAQRELVAELIGQLEQLLTRAATEPRSDAGAPLLLVGATATPLTPWQGYALELRDLCQRVVTEADEKTAVGFWLLLVEMAVRHGRRAGGWPGVSSSDWTPE
jgi:hypothetical protein